MKRIADWPVWAQLSALAAIVATLGTLWAQAEALAEASPLVFKYQMAGFTEALQAIQSRQIGAEYKALKKELNDLRSQRLILKEAIERETDPGEKRAKLLRLESIEIDIRDGDADYIKLRCQIEKAAACP